MTEDKYRQLIIETAANRLVIRALLVHAIISSGAKANRTVTSVRHAIDAMAPHALKLDGAENEMQASVVARVRERACALLEDFGGAHVNN